MKLQRDYCQHAGGTVQWMLQCLRWLWALPLTVWGIVPGLIVWACKGKAHIVDHTLEIHGPLAHWLLSQPWLSFLALTIGHIVIARDDDCCARTRTHEHTHVRQGERWGPLFPFAYTGAGLYCMLRGGRFYWDNPFEIAARQAAQADT
jgi:hypothetical protein